MTRRHQHPPGYLSYDEVYPAGADETAAALGPPRTDEAREPEDASNAAAGTRVSPSPVVSVARVVRMSEVEPEAVRWLWPGRIPAGKLTVVDGDPKVGKSTLMLDLAARVTTGTPLPDDTPTERGNVVLLTAEDGLADTVRPRLAAAGGDAARVVVLESIDETDGRATAERLPSIPGDLDQLEHLIVAEHASLVIIDVLAAYLGAKVDSYRDNDIRRALMPLARMAERTGAAVVVLRHLTKAHGANALYAGGGSIGITGAARAVLLVGRDPDDATRAVLAVSACNVAAPVPALAFRLVPADLYGVARVTWEGQTAHRAGDLLVDRHENGVEDDDDSALTAAVHFLHEVLDDGPVPAKRVKAEARDCGIASRTLDRAKKAAGVVVTRTGYANDGKWWWSIERQKSLTAPYSEHGDVRDSWRPMEGADSEARRTSESENGDRELPWKDR